MARYEYRCDSCGSMQTIEQSILLPVPQEEIPCICGKTQKRIYSSPAVVLNGEGWTPKYYYVDSKDKKTVDI